MTFDSSDSDDNSYNKLNLSDAKLANLKSPCYLKLQAMIHTLQQFRDEYQGARVPFYDKKYLMNKF